MAISDVVAIAAIPEAVKTDMALYAGCISGASTVMEIEKMLDIAGFVDVRITTKPESQEFIRQWAPKTNIAEYIASATIEAVKP